jgi:N-carbamoyl-L-amino-acid hydrolase
VLEDEGITIGVVSGALGQRWYDVTVQGMEAHAGPTPMTLRRDALLPATRLMQRVHEIAMAEQPDGRGTVGHVDVFPNSRNVIPGRVRFSVDFRHLDAAGLARMDAALHAAVAQAATPGVSIEVQQVVEFPPQPFDPALRALIEQGAQRLDLSHRALPSGAGQVLVSPDDAKALAAKANAGIPENWTRSTSAPLKSTLSGVLTQPKGPTHG